MSFLKYLTKQKGTYYQTTFLKIAIRFRQKIQTLKYILTRIRSLPPFLSTNVNHMYDCTVMWLDNKANDMISGIFKSVWWHNQKLSLRGLHEINLLKRRALYELNIANI